MIHQLQNIPAVWTACAHWMACLLYLLLLPRRWKGWRFWSAMAGFLLLQWGLVQSFYTYSGIRFNLGYICFALLCMLPQLALSELPTASSVYYAARAFILGGFSASLAWQLYTYFRQGKPVLYTLWVQCLFLLLSYGAVYGVMLLLERRQRRGLAEMTVSPLACASAVLIAVVIYVFSSLSFSTLDTPFGGASDAEAFNIRTLVYLGGVAILYAYHLQLYENYSHQEVEALQNMLNMQYANYCVSQESIDLINRKYHDLKHQIAILRSEVGTEQRLEYLDQMEQEIRAYEAQNKTGNKVLDTILTSKSLRCQNQGIKLTCVADGALLDFMDVMDLSSLFGNALDNAIEGVSKVPEPEERLIHLSVTQEKQFLRIRVENRCQGQVELRRGLPGTTKKDKRFHGFGLKSICATAAKYGGSATVRAENSWFELRVLIPLTAGE